MPSGSLIFQMAWKGNFFVPPLKQFCCMVRPPGPLLRNWKKTLDGTYTRMLRAVLNVSWKYHPTRARLYGPLPPISHTIRERRVTFAGHCWRSKEELVSDLILWEPRHGKARRGRPRKTYINQLLEDTQLQRDNIEAAMEDREEWQSISGMIRASHPPR